MRRAPCAVGLAQTRWTLDGIREACLWMHDLTLGGVAQLLERLGVSWQRGREAIYSPDEHYEAKRAYLATLRQQVAAQPERLALVYLDEVTIGRQPTVASSYAPRGRRQPRAWRSHQADTVTRVVATLDGRAGRVVYQRATKITVQGLVKFYRALVAAYPQVEPLYVVQDNWPIHTHPDLLVALAPQTSPFAWHRPKNWPTIPRPAAVTRWGHLQLPIQLVPLPTYASWLNPIEKLWRKLRQDVTHLHRWADDLPRLRQEIDSFLDQFARGSPARLQYVGLGLPD